MRGLILNVSDETRTHEALRRQRPLFYADGLPVFEVWIWYEPLRRWLCMSHAFDLRAVRRGVVYFSTMDQLKAQLRTLEDARAA